MKKQLIFSLLLPVSLSTLCAHQAETPKKWVIKTDLALPATAIFVDFHVLGISFAAERLLYNNKSFQITGTYVYANNPERSTISDKYIVFGLIPEYRMYLSKTKTYNGLYIGLYGNYEKYNESTVYLSGKESSLHFNRLGIGASLGYQWNVYKNLLILDLIGGVSANTVFGLKNDYYNSTPYYPSNIQPRLALNVGWKF